MSNSGLKFITICTRMFTNWKRMGILKDTKTFVDVL